MKVFFISSEASEVTAESQNGADLIQLKCFSLTQINKTIKTKGGRWGDSIAKVTCCQAW